MFMIPTKKAHYLFINKNKNKVSCYFPDFVLFYELWAEQMDTENST